MSLRAHFSKPRRSNLILALIHQRQHSLVNHSAYQYHELNPKQLKKKQQHSGRKPIE